MHGIWLKSSPHKKISKAFWQFEGHDWLLGGLCLGDLMIR